MSFKNGSRECPDCSQPVQPGSVDAPIIDAGLYWESDQARLETRLSQALQGDDPGQSPRRASLAPSNCHFPVATPQPPRSGTRSLLHSGGPSECRGGATTAVGEGPCNVTFQVGCNCPDYATFVGAPSPTPPRLVSAMGREMSLERRNMRRDHPRRRVASLHPCALDAAPARCFCCCCRCSLRRNTRSECGVTVTLLISLLDSI